MIENSKTCEQNKTSDRGDMVIGNGGCRDALCLDMGGVHLHKDVEIKLSQHHQQATTFITY